MTSEPMGGSPGSQAAVSFEFVEHLENGSASKAQNVFRSLLVCHNKCKRATWSAQGHGRT
jgi:hypothetical protein